jgi:hypothetical protein
MFADKERVEKRLREYVSNYYAIPQSEFSHLSHENDVGESIRKMMVLNTRYVVNEAIKQFGHGLVNVLIQELYSHEDFERDIGLR